MIIDIVIAPDCLSFSLFSNGPIRLKLSHVNLACTILEAGLPLSKQTALVGMDGRMLAKHSIVFVFRHNISAGFRMAKNTRSDWLLHFEQI